MDIQCFYGEFKALGAKKETAAKEAVKAGKDPAAKGPAKPDTPTKTNDKDAKKAKDKEETTA